MEQPPGFVPRLHSLAFTAECRKAFLHFAIKAGEWSLGMRLVFAAGESDDRVSM